MDDFWVFGYGSLMWRPGFDFIAQDRARLYGYRRTLCVHSYVHRGTKERPGLVLGLDRGGSCNGMAFKVSGTQKDSVLGYLRDRELVTNVYIERVCNIQISSGVRVPAYCFIVDKEHEQYADGLGVDEAAKIVGGASGRSGNNCEYVRNTVEQLRSMNLKDDWLEQVNNRLD